jgi:hypothetical protein
MDWQTTLPEWLAPELVSNAEIIAWIKQWCNHELQSSDYTQLPDVDLANKSDWAVYRQELRDLPQQGADPKLWVFPVPPT